MGPFYLKLIGFGLLCFAMGIIQGISIALKYLRPKPQTVQIEVDPDNNNVTINHVDVRV